MAYDPQANRRRPQADTNGPAPVEALLGASPASTPETSSTTALNEDPPPTPAVTPAPADPPSDTLLMNTGLIAALGALLTALMLRHLWRRRTQRQRPTDLDD